MKEAIRTRATELDFDACRVTTAAAPPAGPRLLEWLSAGRQGQMQYLERNAAKRVDPQKVLPGCRSIITLAVSYASNAGEGPNSARARPAGPTGVIARYARYSDDHDLLAERLKTLTANVDQLGGAGTRSLWYVDTGPVL